MNSTQLIIKVNPQIIRDFQISLFVLLNITGSRIGFKTVQEVCHIKYVTAYYFLSYSEQIYDCTQLKQFNN